MAVIELWAGNRGLTRAVVLVTVPRPSWRWGFVGTRGSQVSRNAPSWILFTAGRFLPGLLQPLIQLPLGSRGVLSL